MYISALPSITEMPQHHCKLTQLPYVVDKSVSVRIGHFRVGPVKHRLRRNFFGFYHKKVYFPKVYFYFHNVYFAKVYFPKVYFPKVYFPKVYFPKVCTVQ